MYIFDIFGSILNVYVPIYESMKTMLAYCICNKQIIARRILKSSILELDFLQNNSATHLPNLEAEAARQKQQQQEQVCTGVFLIIHTKEC